MKTMPFVPSVAVVLDRFCFSRIMNYIPKEKFIYLPFML